MEDSSSRRERGEARNPYFWFPNEANSLAVQVTSLETFCLCGLSIAFFYEEWGRYLAVGLLVDFSLRMLSGLSLSPLGMTATFLVSFFKPSFRLGPPIQLDCFFGVLLSAFATLFYFLSFQGHEVLGAIFMGILAVASGLTGFLDISIGSILFGHLIKKGWIPSSICKIYDATIQETTQAWDYKYRDSQAPVPTRVDTDPTSAISYKYIKKTDHWTKDDFDVVRHIQIHYFAMPLAIGGLAAAFKIAGNWSSRLQINSIQDPNGYRSIVVSDAWYKVFAFMGAFFFCTFLVLYAIRLLFYPQKIIREWTSPFKSHAFGFATSTITLYAFLVYDEINPENASGQAESSTHQFARVLWWIGSVGHAIVTVINFGEWVGRRFDLDHMQALWMTFPLGLAISAMIAPIVGVFKSTDADSVRATSMVARFFYSFAWLMWVVLFIMTFFKTVTTHNSDDRLRHGAWNWISVPCILGLASYLICAESSTFSADQCDSGWVEQYFIGFFIFLAFLFASLPSLAFFGNNHFEMGYWIEVFALDSLAACASLFYAINGWKFSEIMELIFLTVAAIANMAAFWHTFTAVIRERDVFTPEPKWGPLSFIRLTHEALRGNMTKIRQYLGEADIYNESDEGKKTLDLFVACFNRFCIVHEEHSRHEDDVIFKTFNDYFPQVSQPWNDDHDRHHQQLETWRNSANNLVDKGLDKVNRKAALDKLRNAIPAFFDEFEDHLRGEDDNLNEIARKYLSCSLMVQMSRQVWDITDAKRWEVIIPFVVRELPRHPQRVQYLKVMTWSLPERAQQIGAILYRNVDEVMWERLRASVPEIIPRAAPNYKRYY